MPSDALIARPAARQHGNVAAWRLRELGFGNELQMLGLLTPVRLTHRRLRREPYAVVAELTTALTRRVAT